MKKAKSIIFNLIFVVLCVVVAYFLSNYLFASIPIEGISMEQTIHHDDIVIVFKRGKYNVGDVVVFDPDYGDRKRLIKRIIGMPGDTIEIKEEADGYYVYRNGEKLIEDYTNKDNPMVGTYGPVTVPEGKFFYLGDNRGSSSDSRLGYLGDLDTIVGRVILRYQPGDKKFDLTVVKRG
ncbi:MAG: signal peptidase I [Clostridiales bacterium]|nr:signal peptidase I [Clostridiales bacterium]